MSQGYMRAVGITKAGSAALLVAGLLVVAASPMSHATPPGHVSVNCTTPGRTATPADNQICLDLVSVLTRTYPGFAFDTARQKDSIHLNVSIRNATVSGLGLQLAWTTPAGAKTEGELMSVSAMDRNLTSAQRQSLYHRIVAATPMPK